MRLAEGCSFQKLLIRLIILISVGVIPLTRHHDNVFLGHQVLSVYHQAIGNQRRRALNVRSVDLDNVRGSPKFFTSNYAIFRPGTGLGKVFHPIHYRHYLVWVDTQV
jgi:hypothetical protein